MCTAHRLQGEISNFQESYKFQHACADFWRVFDGGEGVYVWSVGQVHNYTLSVCVACAVYSLIGNKT